MTIKYFAIPNAQFGYKQLYEATTLVDDAFCSGYFTNHLKEIKCAWVAMDNEKIVGWASVQDCTLRCIVVDPQYRGQGIAQKLTEERLKYLGDCDQIISYAWVRPDGTCMSCKNLENFGFKLHQELEDYYYNTRTEGCKYCGGGCRCIARQYVKTNQL